MKGAREKARAKIKATYGVDISDKALLQQIVDIAKQAYGGNLDMAIRSQQIRDLVELYAMSTGQKPTGMPGTARPTTLAQMGGSLYQQNGSPLPSSAAACRPSTRSAPALRPEPARSSSSWTGRRRPRSSAARRSRPSWRILASCSAPRWPPPARALGAAR